MDDEDDRRSPEPGRREEDLWMLWANRIKDVVLFMVGTYGFIHQFFLTAPQHRDGVILSFAALLVGLPVASFIDAVRTHRKDHPDAP
jgi:hypothetical protein